MDVAISEPGSRPLLRNQRRLGRRHRLPGLHLASGSVNGAAYLPVPDAQLRPVSQALNQLEEVLSKVVP